MKRIIIIFITIISFSCSDDSPTKTDSKIETITIGSQVWMKKNLDVDHYRNGDPIPEVQNSIQWANLNTGAWCYYYNDEANGKIYGKQYNWYAVSDPRGLAPEGWHVPSDTEWMVLEIFLGIPPEYVDWDIFRSTTEGGKLKSTGTLEKGDGLWLDPNKGATNESGFTGLPGSLRYIDGSFYDINRLGFWWTSTPSSSNESKVWCRVLDYGTAEINRNNLEKVCGLSVRCIKD